MDRNSYAVGTAWTVGLSCIETTTDATNTPPPVCRFDTRPWSHASAVRCDAPGSPTCSVSSVNSPRVSPALVLLSGAAALVLTLSACGSKTEDAAGPSVASSAESSIAKAAADGCPSTAPTDAGTPQWTLPGATGSVAVTGSTDTAAPVVTVEAPFSVTETQVKTLSAGDGPVVAPTATVSVCYMGVNGRDGSVFDSSYERGEPAQFPLDGVVPGFQKAISGQKVGSTVAVAMTSADGYPNGQPRAGIEAGDSLIFAIKILGAN